MSALTIITGMVKNVSILLALEGKFGKEPTVFAQPIRISMAKCVLSALMGRFGIQSRKNACVKMDTNGIANIAKEHGSAQEIECGIQHMNSVFAEITIFGVGMLAYLFQLAKVANIGIQY